MKKTLLCISLVLAIVSSTVAIIGTWFGPLSAARSEKPNIVFVLTDDMRKDDLRFVPETRRLVGNRGMEFENAFVTFAMCCPSRASILTGLYPHNHRVFTNEPPEGGEPGFRHLDNSTLATWIDDAGYRTALIGKYFNGYSGTYKPPGWDVWYPNGSDTLRARRTEHFIRASAQDRAPFFAYVALQTPHPSAKPPARYADRYPNLRSPVRMTTLSPLFESSSLLPLGLPHSLHGISKAVYERLFCGPCLTPLLVRVGLHPIEFLGPILTKDKRRLSFSKKPPPP